MRGWQRFAAVAAEAVQFVAEEQVVPLESVSSLFVNVTANCAALAPEEYVLMSGVSSDGLRRCAM